MRFLRPPFSLLIIFLYLVPLQLLGQDTNATKPIEIYISTAGDDNHSGTKEQPLASLQGARDAIRKLKSERQVDKPVMVTIMGGSYQMMEPFVLLPQDGGTLENPVVYRAAEGSKVEFSGGRRITGFKVNKYGIWEVHLRQPDQLGWRFDQLYVNGSRVTMARTPNKGFATISDIEEEVWVKGGAAYKR